MLCCEYDCYDYVHFERALASLGCPVSIRIFFFCMWYLFEDSRGLSRSNLLGYWLAGPRALWTIFHDGWRWRSYQSVKLHLKIYATTKSLALVGRCFCSSCCCCLSISLSLATLSLTVCNCAVVDALVRCFEFQAADKIISAPSGSMKQRRTTLNETFVCCIMKSARQILMVSMQITTKSIFQHWWML